MTSSEIADKGIDSRTRGSGTLGGELCRKYALTSLNVGGGAAGLLAIDEAVERCAQIADECDTHEVADRIRELKTYCQDTNAAANGSS